MGSNNSSSSGGFALFSVITLFYVIAQYISGYGNTAAANEWLIFGIYIIISTIVMAATNTFVVGKNCKAVNKSVTRSKVWMYTILFFTLPMTITALMLHSFTGWLTPFSNTFGYVIANFMIGENLNELLRKETTESSLPEKIGSSIGWIYNNPTIFLNALKPSDLNDSNWASFSSTIFDTANLNDEAKTSLMKFLVLKDTVSTAVWFLLIGWLCGTITENMANKYACTGIKSA